MTTKKQTKTKAAATVKDGAAFNKANKDLIEATADAPGYDAQRLNDFLWHFRENETVSFDNIINLSDLFAASGFFGTLTPAQIGVQILAGRELGFSPVASMFNLSIAPGKIEFAEKNGQPRFLVLQDVAERLGRAAGASRANLENATASDYTAPDDEKDASPAPDGFEQGETARLAEKPHICPVCLRQQQSELQNDAKLTDGELIKVCSPGCAAEVEARTRNAKIVNAEMAQAGYPPNAPEAAENTGDGGKSNLKEYVMQTDEKRHAKKQNDLAPVKGVLEKVKIESPAGDGADGAGDDDAPMPKAVSEWRRLVESYCSELFAPDVAVAKLEKFDGLATVVKKREMFDTVKKYYADGVDKLRTEIETVFNENNWLPDSRERSVYVEPLFVPVDPLRWTYANALTIRAELVKDKML